MFRSRTSSDPIEINHAVIADLTVGEMSKIHHVDGSTGIQILHVMVTTGVLYGFKKNQMNEGSFFGKEVFI